MKFVCVEEPGSDVEIRKEKRIRVVRAALRIFQEGDVGKEDGFCKHNVLPIRAEDPYRLVMDNRLCLAEGFGRVFCGQYLYFSGRVFYGQHNPPVFVGFLLTDHANERDRLLVLAAKDLAYGG